MNMNGWGRFNPYAHGFSMGATDWTARAEQVIANYDALIKRTAAIENDKTRSEILAWIGDGSIPGTPSDRYRFVEDVLLQGGPWDEGHMRYVEDLENATQELSVRVDAGEKSGTFGNFGPLSAVTPQGTLTNVGIGLLIVVALGLVVVPAVLE